jgi:hypothetical protein
MAGVPGYMTSKTHTRLGSLMYSGPTIGQQSPQGAVSFLLNRFNETTKLMSQDEMGIIAEVVAKGSPLSSATYKGKQNNYPGTTRSTFGSKKPSTAK